MHTKALLAVGTSTGELVVYQQPQYNEAFGSIRARVVFEPLPIRAIHCGMRIPGLGEEAAGGSVHETHREFSDLKDDLWVTHDQNVVVVVNVKDVRT